MNIIEDIILKEIYNKNPANLDDPNIFVNSGQGLEGIKKESLFKIKEINELDKSTEILIAFYDYNYTAGDFWTAARTNISSLIFLEDRISLRIIEETTGWDKKENYEKDIYWHEIEEAKPILIEEKDINNEKVENYYVRIFFNSSHKYEDIDLIYFGWMVGENDCLFISELINNIIEKLNNQQDETNNDLTHTVEDIRTNATNGEFALALELIKNNFDLNTIIESDSILYYFLIYHNSLCLKGLGYNKEALKLLDERIIKSDTSEGYEDWNNSLFELKAEINEVLGNHYNSLQNFYFAYQNTEEIELKSNLKEKISSSYNNFKESFGELQYDKRKMVLIYDEVKISPSDSFIVLDKSNLPTNIKFPFTHPKKEEIYIGHPYLKESYLPFSSFEADLFNDRFEEFSYFIQCLGAKSMTIKVIKENEKTTTEIDNTNTTGSIGLGKNVVKNTLDLGYQNNKDSDKKEDSKTSRTRTQNYNPTKKPYIPENLLWYPHETSWYRIYQQRINGNILSHHDIISSKSTHSISNNEKSNLKIGLKTFFSDNNLNRDSFIKNTIDETESIEWEIFVEFESLENLKEDIEKPTLNIENITLSDAENQYKEELLFMLEDDGIIDDKERRILNRLKDKLKINDEIANKIESDILILKEYTQNEKEYIEEYIEFLNEGEITEKERRILNRFATRLELTEERVSELENSLR